MDQFITQIVHYFELANFGVCYEDLVPVCCSSLKWKDTKKDKDEFTNLIVKFLISSSTNDSYYNSFLNEMREIVEVYWSEIVMETEEFNKIKTRV
jgi:hypothetical protein